MKRIFFFSLLIAAATIVNAVPARPGWIAYTQADGSTIDLQIVGDEFAHCLINRDGQQVKLNAQGMYEVVGQAPSPAKLQARRAANKARKVRKQFGVTPNLAPRGIVIMVNFTDKEFLESHPNSVIDSLCNAKDCKVNKSGGTNYPSAAQYFSDQSNGAYHPVFDVYGPVTLSNDVQYYGENDGTSSDNDVRPANMVVEACKLVDALGVDFTLYDSDDDGKIDFVYVIYAGKGEASGGSANTIWPHSYSIGEQLALEQYYSLHPDEFYEDYGAEFVPYFTDEYAEADCYVDEKMINTYACSNELSGNSLDGIGTLCHEFGHVMGLPDFYDIYYDVNNDQKLTPGDWDVMDGGAYNKSGHCPPNYNVWEKYFFGWHQPINLGNKEKKLNLIANGQEGYQAYQITAGNDLVGPTDSLQNDAPVYYIENRQQQGWDRGLGAHGLLIWKVSYSESAWTANEPNCEAYSPRFTLVCSEGSKIGGSNASKNVFPHGLTKSWTGIANKPLKQITENDGVISLVYINEPAVYTVRWVVDGEVIEEAEYAKNGFEDLRLPEKAFEPCDDEWAFVGWTAEYPNWADPFKAPYDMFSEANGKVTADVTYYAVFFWEDIPEVDCLKAIQQGKNCGE